MIKRNLLSCLFHQELLYDGQVGFFNDAHLTQVTFTLLALLGQDVTLVSMSSFNHKIFIILLLTECLAQSAGNGR